MYHFLASAAPPDWFKRWSWLTGSGVRLFSYPSAAAGGPCVLRSASSCVWIVIHVYTYRCLCSCLSNKGFPFRTLLLLKNTVFLASIHACRKNFLGFSMFQMNWTGFLYAHLNTTWETPVSVKVEFWHLYNHPCVVLYNLPIIHQLKFRFWVMKYMCPLQSFRIGCPKSKSWFRATCLVSLLRIDIRLVEENTVNKHCFSLRSSGSFRNYQYKGYITRFYMKIMFLEELHLLWISLRVQKPWFIT